MLSSAEFIFIFRMSNRKNRIFLMSKNIANSQMKHPDQKIRNKSKRKYIFAELASFSPIKNQEQIKLEKKQQPIKIIINHNLPQTHRFQQKLNSVKIEEDRKDANIHPKNTKRLNKFLQLMSAKNNQPSNMDNKKALGPSPKVSRSGQLSLPDKKKLNVFFSYISPNNKDVHHSLSKSKIRIFSDSSKQQKNHLQTKKQQLNRAPIKSTIKQQQQKESSHRSNQFSNQYSKKQQ